MNTPMGVGKESLPTIRDSERSTPVVDRRSGYEAGCVPVTRSRKAVTSASASSGALKY